MSNRSFLSIIAELILKKTKPDYMNSHEKIELFLTSKMDEKELEEIKDISYGDNYSDNGVVLYLHGGAYVNPLNMQHRAYCYILSRVLKRRVIALSYPLTPKYTYRESYELLCEEYNELIDNYAAVTLMGDSAGAGLVLGFCQYLNSIDSKLPDNIIVFSPWVDVSMKNNYDDKDDPILGNIGLREIGKRWSGTLDTTDYRVSPLYGDNHNFPRTLIITGTNEIFYPYIKEYYEKLVDDDVDAKLIVGGDLFHVYPLFPIPEAISILKEIKKEMKMI